MGLATFKGSRDRLKPQAMGSGQSHRTGHLIINEVASPMGLATFKGSRDRLKPEAMGSGQSHGTGHFQRVSRQAEN